VIHDDSDHGVANNTTNEVELDTMMIDVTMAAGIAGMEHGHDRHIGGRIAVITAATDTMTVGTGAVMIDGHRHIIGRHRRLVHLANATSPLEPPHPIRYTHHPSITGEQPACPSS
jgi:hypothetical protein